MVVATKYRSVEVLAHFIVFSYLCLEYAFNKRLRYSTCLCISLLYIVLGSKKSRWFLVNKFPHFLLTSLFPSIETNSRRGAPYVVGRGACSRVLPDSKFLVRARPGLAMPSTVPSRWLGVRLLREGKDTDVSIGSNASAWAKYASRLLTRSPA